MHLVKIAIGLVTVLFVPFAHSFILGGYLPYWKHEAGIDSAIEHINDFDQLSPFSFEVDHKGNLIDKFKRSNRWNELYDHCKKKAIKVVPTIFWTNTQAMHHCLSDEKIRKHHLDAIMNKVISNHFDGININYERLSSQDRNHFLTFMTALSEALHKLNLVLYCSIGGRTGDTSIGVVCEAEKNRPPSKNIQAVKPKSASVSLYPGSGKEAAHYKEIMDRCCDQIHIMGYDEWGTPCRTHKIHMENQYYLSHASDQWIEQIIDYGLSYIPAHKLILGIPTYGLEFAIYPKKDTISFKKIRSITYGDACALANKHKQQPKSTAGNEVSFTYQHGRELRYVCFMTSESIKSKIAIAQRRGISGIYLFKIDGLEDKSMWRIIKEAHASKSPDNAQIQH